MLYAWAWTEWWCMESKTKRKQKELIEIKKKFLFYNLVDEVYWLKNMGLSDVCKTDLIIEIERFI